MKTNDTHSHCPEVENLMGGRMPFVTLHSQPLPCALTIICSTVCLTISFITLVALVLIVVAGILMLSDGTPQQLMKEMVRHTVEQIMVRAQGI